MKLKLLLGGLAIAAATCGPVAAADNVKIGFITKFPVPFFATMENAAKAYAEANPGVEIIYGQGTSATDIEGQIAQIESMVTQGVQGIALTPVDPTVAPALDKAIAQGVKIVLMDNNIPDWKGRTSLATTDNYAAGKLAGEDSQRSPISSCNETLRRGGMMLRSNGYGSVAASTISWVRFSNNPDRPGVERHWEFAMTMVKGGSPPNRLCSRPW